MGLKLKDYFVFDGESSADFGFFASGENVYNSPEKDYDTYEIPGRNGDITISNNRFKNVTVTYPCYYEKAGGNLTRDISNFQNMLLSKDGYKRLYDTHNPNEYRIAVCKDMIEMDPTEYEVLAAVEIEFDCKPQRYLKSGENQIIYPTGIEDSPNLVKYPYYRQSQYGDVWRNHGVTWRVNADRSVTCSGKTDSAHGYSFIQSDNLLAIDPTKSYVVSGCNGGSSSTYRFLIDCWADGADTSGEYTRRFYLTNGEVTIPTGYAYIAMTVYIYLGFDFPSGVTFKPMIRLASDEVGEYIPPYNGTTEIYNPTKFPSKPLLEVTGYGTVGIGDITITITGTANQVTYIDCDMMESYRESGASVVSANNLVSFSGNDYPVIEPYVSGISLGSNISEVVITPHWWRI